MKSKQLPWHFAYVIGAVSSLLLLQLLWGEARTSDIVPYSEFEQALDSGRIDRVVVSDRRLIGQLKSADSQGRVRLVTNRLEPDLAERLGA